MSRTCTTCRGAGKIIRDVCRQCRGEGRIEQEKTLEIKIPAGVDSGSRLRVAGEGEAALLALEEAKRQALLDLAEQQNGEWLDTENDKLDAYADDLETAFAADVKSLEAEIKEAKKALRGASLAMQDKLAEKRRISALEAKRDKMKAEFFDRRAQIRAEVENMLDAIQENLKIAPTLTPLFTIQWEVK